MFFFFICIFYEFSRALSFDSFPFRFSLFDFILILKKKPNYLIKLESTSKKYLLIMIKLKLFSFRKKKKWNDIVKLDTM